MTARSIRFRSLACLLALALPALAPAAPKGPREHPRGMFGQDELRRSLRQIENDWDLLVLAWERAEKGVQSASEEEQAIEGLEETKAAVRDELVALEDALDEARDAYESRATLENVAAAEELLERMIALEQLWWELEVPAALREAWEQCAIDGRRLRQEAELNSGKLTGQLPRIAAQDPVRVAAAEVEDLSDNLKRLLLRTGAEASVHDSWVAKPGGSDRHRVHRGRFERALLEFEEAADELKARYRKKARPAGLRPLIDRLVRSARTIDYTVADASIDPEALREWTETLEPLHRLLSAHGYEGIGVGWETHR